MSVSFKWVRLERETSGMNAMNQPFEEMREEKKCNWLVNDRNVAPAKQKIVQIKLWEKMLKNRIEMRNGILDSVGLLFMQIS